MEQSVHSILSMRLSFMTGSLLEISKVTNQVFPSFLGSLMLEMGSAGKMYWIRKMLYACALVGEV